MPKRRRSKKRTSDYKPVFTSAENKLMQNYGVGNLMDEVGINRVMLVRTLDKMKDVREQLTFRDHLDALRAVSYTTGRIASLLDTRERLYKPYQKVEEQYRDFFDQIVELNDKMGIELHGEEKWGQMRWNELRKSIGLVPIDFEDDAHDGSETD